MLVTTKKVISLITGETLQHEYFWYNGEVELCCGATAGQTAVGNAQTTFFNNATNQATQIFGNASTVFKNIMASVGPIVAAGPSQEGFSQGEQSALNSQVITQTGQNYTQAKEAVGEAEAAQGGGNTVMPGGANVSADIATANAAAAQKSTELNQVNLADYAQGNQNYEAAVGAELNAPNVFNTANSAVTAATGAGEAASNTQNQIAQENQSWIQSVTGALGGIAGAVISENPGDIFG